MAHLRIKRIEIQGFRAYGARSQVAEIDAPIAVFWAPNSKGKTSLAEAIEFLLTGSTIKRQIFSSRQDEFADSLRHAHLPDNVETFVAATVEQSDSTVHIIKRVLIKDYAKQGNCESRLFINEVEADENELSKLGIVLAHPPLCAPVLAQHTLNYLFTTKPSERTSYFKALLEVADLDETRAEVAKLESGLASVAPSQIQKLNAAVAIPAANRSLSNGDLTDLSNLEAAFLAGSKALLAAEELAVPKTLDACVDVLQQVLDERRSKAFPLQLFSRKPFVAPTWPDEELWNKLQQYVAEKAVVDLETRRLTALFKAALEIPEIDELGSNLDCPLCGTDQTLTPERIAFIKDRLSRTEAYQAAKSIAVAVLHDLQSRVNSCATVSGALPRFAMLPRRARKGAGFTSFRLRELLGDAAIATLPRWRAALLQLCRTRRNFLAETSATGDLLEVVISAPGEIQDIQAIKEAFMRLRRAAEKFQLVEEEYGAYTQPLHNGLREILDAQSASTGWQDFIDLAIDLPALRQAMIDQAVQEQIRLELRKTLKQIDKGIEQVLDEKFDSLSATIVEWWTRLRGSEPTFFEAVRRRGRKTIDFKVGLLIGDNRADMKVRDVIAIFSDSQLHCLGLAIFLARAEYYNMPFVVLDDPVLSSDEDYRAHFRSRVIKRLCELNIQVIVLTQHQGTRRDIANANEHLGVDQYQIEIIDPGRGSLITRTHDELNSMLARVEAYLNTDAVEIRRDGARNLRAATERFCKMLLVKQRREAGDAHSAISDYQGQMLGGKLGLIQQVVPFLTIDPSHPGKLNTLHADLNPASHDDDDVPSRQVLRESLGNLRRLRKDYIG